MEGMTKLNVQPLDVNFSLKDKVYDALRQAIMSMDIYASSEELRLDERQLADNGRFRDADPSCTRPN